MELPNTAIQEDQSGYSGDQGNASEEHGDIEFSDEWEHYSDFVVTESSGSDWI